MPCYSHKVQIAVAFCLLHLAAPAPAEGILTGILKARTAQLKLQRVEADGRTLSAALHIYKINGGEFPTEKQGLKALVEKPTEAPLPRRWVKIMDKVPVDAWGREYRLVTRMKDDKPVLTIISDGPDVEALKDDIEMPVVKPEPAAK